MRCVADLKLAPCMPVRCMLLLALRQEVLCLRAGAVPALLRHACDSGALIAAWRAGAGAVRRAWFGRASSYLPAALSSAVRRALDNIASSRTGTAPLFAGQQQIRCGERHAHSACQEATCKRAIAGQRASAGEGGMP
jgi:hypothetical protein